MIIWKKISNKKDAKIKELENQLKENLYIIKELNDIKNEKNKEVLNEKGEQEKSNKKEQNKKEVNENLENKNDDVKRENININ